MVQLSFVEKAENIIFIGEPGTGKAGSQTNTPLFYLDK
ncbi:MAG: hypothetical protein JRJ51_23205 [Deltaproteobacteria bacterium]|nr:hypothetical protein [Deltaproteobacteria bacterium]